MYPCFRTSKILLITHQECLSLTLVSDETEQLWAWEYEVEDSKHDLFMDIGEEIR